MNPIEYEYEYKTKYWNDNTKSWNDSKLEQYIQRNHNQIVSMKKLDYQHSYKERYQIKKMKTIDTHFSCPQVGVEVLSMAKRIMNEVTCLAEDHNVEMYYQDTDSIHTPQATIKKLADLYDKTYDKKLIGKGLGQFSEDFDFRK